MRRTGGISTPRFNRAIDTQRSWAQANDGYLAHPSSGANTAYAVTVFHDLADELKAAGSSIDIIANALIDSPQISEATLKQAVYDALGHPSKVLKKVLPE